LFQTVLYQLEERENMSDKDLGEELENIEEGIENLKNKEFKLFGIKMTPMTIGAAVTAIGSVIGMLYGGFLMYQKVEQAIEFVDQQTEYEEKIADFAKRMEIMETKMEETVEYARDIKGGLRDDILRIEQQSDRTEDMVRKSIDDVRNMISDAEARFETKRDSLRQQVVRDTKELEDRLDSKIQRALDNPLAN
jgi:LPS O-antigen subunit length determinant protein (WzzB/FepE family)